MIDFILKIFSAVFGMNMRDPHDVPFALPLLLFIFLAFIITMTVLHFIDPKENEGAE